ncbi:hypothetical protein GWO43_25290 [candidate division KSB1 bacterium]|nr:hypothetical protein [candidate division KSB1 bacterium]NIR68873.1 hypothetical protein [candidate division KSB1 bacterium]NIS27241.1 hypothetical protein [candidate division KSB1 bacterium]NIT74126.1 hypothetical protein [candidate division KSB1 bacterium]NIU27975.1 hypothetical protein [candidate division KSB1 bacterium]
MIEFFEAFDLDSCIQDVPAPTLLAEPRFTQGTTNKICFQLPRLEIIPFPVDTIRNPFVTTVAQDVSADTVRALSRPVDLLDSPRQLETFISLIPGRSYSYTSALILPVCKIACEDVTDPSELEVHCSAFMDTVWSMQDSEAPVVESVDIPQLDSTAFAVWWNRPTIRIEAQLSDPAGVWQSALFVRDCSTTGWESALTDTTFPGELTRNGFVFSETASSAFNLNLADGCYEFRVEGKDASHTPQSCFGNFELEGNGGQPLANSPAHVNINIDTTPPESVNLTCSQKLNTIELNWTPSADTDAGIGLAGYLILRDGAIVDSALATETTYVDTFSETIPDTEFAYQIQPYDSLRNIRQTGGMNTCQFRNPSRISMVPEPDFSAGTSNQVCWQGSDRLDSFTVFIAEACDFENAMARETSDTCFTFTNLKDGGQYCYWVEGVDPEQRTIRSDTVRSIQDASVPVIITMNIEDKIVLNSGNWVRNRETSLKFAAQDNAPGEIQQLQIFLNGVRDSVITVSTVKIDTTLSLNLTISECDPTSIAAKVIDGAGNASSLQSVDLILDSSSPEPVAEIICTQLRNLNGIRIQWGESFDALNCSGLAGYRLIRNGVVADTVGPSLTSYDDIFSVETPSGRFTYAVHPFDSLGQVQVGGMTVDCNYIGAPRVELQPMAEFTPGLTKQICWTMSSPLVYVKAFIDEDCDLVPEDSVTTMNPTQSELCHTFENLKDGKKYCYWVKGVDEHDRTARSQNRSSIQDNTHPTIDAFSLQNGEMLDGQLWSFSREVELNLIAHDQAPGEIWNYEIVENGVSRTSGTFSDSVSRQNTSIQHQLHAQGSEPEEIELSIRVFDGAGNASLPNSMGFFFQEDLKELIAFPNPFNPMKRAVVIRFDDTFETEVRIFDFFGNLVRAIDKKANSHDFVWDGRNGEGEVVANGGYICVGTKTGRRFKIGVMKEF